MNRHDSRLALLARLVTGARHSLRQVVLLARSGRKPTDVLLQWRVGRSIQAESVPRRPRQSGSAWAVMMVKNEEDVLSLVVDHLVRQGISGIIIGDNNSDDATLAIAHELSHRYPQVHVARVAWDRYDQSEVMTHLARLAGRAGADWIVPVDADEFWFAKKGTLASYLADLSRSQPTVTIIYCEWLNMIPTGEPRPLAPEREFVMDAHPVFPGKVLVKAHRLVRIGQGNHSAIRAGSHKSGDVVVAHAIYRNPSQVARKFRQGVAAYAGSRHETAWHWKAGAMLTEEEIRQVWARLAEGGAEPSIGIAAVGPMVRVTPLLWSFWDPESVVPRTAS